MADMADMADWIKSKRTRMPRWGYATVYSRNQKFFPIPFTPKDVVSFGYAHQPFACAPTLYYALVHEFGPPMVEDAFDSEANM